MTFRRAVPRLGALPELRTYVCTACGVTYTEGVELDAARIERSCSEDKVETSRASR